MLYYSELQNRAIITVSGSDAREFLQGLVTGDMQKVTPVHSIYCCMLTPQGRFLYDFFISQIAEEVFLLDCFRLVRDDIIAKLTMYKLRSNVQIAPLDDLNIYHLSEIKEHSHAGDHVSMLEGFAFWDPRDINFGLRAYLRNAPIDYAANPKAYDYLRILRKIPEGGKDMIEAKSFPLEYNMEQLGAIDFKKGCYVGQEVTARTKYRGLIRKTIYLCETIGEMAAVGSEILFMDKKIGTLCSHHDNIALALIRIEEFAQARGSHPTLEAEMGGMKVMIHSN
ncbi:MAG: hypothetical protein RIT35_1105 [Pseudomonadota bacterium]|jgi:folate-binding protein YgfZ